MKVYAMKICIVLSLFVVSLVCTLNLVSSAFGAAESAGLLQEERAAAAAAAREAEAAAARKAEGAAREREVVSGAQISAPASTGTVVVSSQQLHTFEGPALEEAPEAQSDGVGDRGAAVDVQTTAEGGSSVREETHKVLAHDLDTIMEGRAPGSSSIAMNGAGEEPHSAVDGLFAAVAGEGEGGHSMPAPNGENPWAPLNPEPESWMSRSSGFLRSNKKTLMSTAIALTVAGGGYGLLCWQRK